MSIYLGKNKVSIKYNASSDPGPTPVDPSGAYQNVMTKVKFCKDAFLSEGGKSSYAGAWLALRNASQDYEDFTLSNTGVVAIKTSDGHFYSIADGTTVSHQWDSTKDIHINEIDDETFRWVIYYYYSDSINSHLQDLDCKKGCNIVYVFDMELKYFSTGGNESNAQGLFRYNDALQGFDLINGHKCTAASNNSTSFGNFCWSCRSLVMLPESLDISNIQTLTYFCYQCYSLVKLPDNLDTSKCKYFSYFCGYCYSLKSLPENLDTSFGYSLDFFCAYCRKMSRLPENLNVRAGGNFKQFCAGCASLESLPENMTFDNATSLDSLCMSCVSLKKLPEPFVAPKCDQYGYFCYDCNSLISLPIGLDISKGSSFNSFCANCFALTKSHEILDISNGTSFNSFFMKCAALSDIKLKLPSYSVSMNSSSNLTVGSLRYISDNAPSVTSCTLTIGSANIARANKYDPTIISNLNAKGWTVN